MKDAVAAQYHNSVEITLDLTKVQHDYTNKHLRIQVPTSGFQGQYFTEEAQMALKEILGRRPAEMQMESAAMQLWDAQVQKFLSDLIK